MTKMPRMTGNVTGNFGVPKRKAGSPLMELGVTDADVVKITPVSEYNHRLIQAFHITNDAKLKRFIIEELQKFHTQRGTFETRL
jgi:hypothetical protein